MYKNHINCRVCGNPNLKPYLDLGEKPLSNNLLNAPDEKPQLFPLKVLLCEVCGLSQLSIVVDPETLFGHYVYRSSMSQGYKDHCREMAVDLAKKYGLNSESFHIDIAGNDGALLHEFKEVLKYNKCLNVDPARNLADMNEAQGIRMFTTFWGVNAARHLNSTDWPKADLITATNVFAHVDSVYEFLEAINMTLNRQGVAIIEFPYIKDFIDKNEFDTVYFEHLSYFSIIPLDYLCKRLGLELINVTHHDIHGGSVRCHIAKFGAYTRNANVDMFVDMEKQEGFNKLELYTDWAGEVQETVTKFSILMRQLAVRNTVYGFAASAKGNVLLNCAGITTAQMRYIIDETPEKLGKFSPGTGIPINGMARLTEDPPDYLVILSWNFAEEIIKKCRKAGYKGKFLLPLTQEIIY
jgi:hypothetical protein